MPKQKKKFKETKVGKFLSEQGSTILDVVGDFVPGGQVLKAVAGMIEKDDSISSEARIRAIELIQLEIAQEAEVTKRWEADVNSDSWLSKNVRPLIALYSWILLTVVTVFFLVDSDLPDFVLNLVGGLTATITAAYFGAREYGKAQVRKIEKDRE